MAMLLSSKVLLAIVKPTVAELVALSRPIREVFSVFTRTPLEKLLRKVQPLIDPFVSRPHYCSVIRMPLPPAGLTGTEA